MQQPLTRRKTMVTLVVFASLGLFMGFYISAIARERWYLLVMPVLLGMSAVFVLTYRWAQRRYETRTPEQLNARVSDKMLGLTALGSSVGFAIFQAGGPILLVNLMLIPFFLSFVCGIMLVYYQRIAVASEGRPGKSRLP